MAFCFVQIKKPFKRKCVSLCVHMSIVLCVLGLFLSLSLSPFLRGASKLLKHIFLSLSFRAKITFFT